MCRLLVIILFGLLLVCGCKKDTSAVTGEEEVPTDCNQVIYAVRTDSENRIFIGTNSNYIFYSADGGNTWKKSLVDTLGGTVREIHIYKNIILVSLDNNIYKASIPLLSWEKTLTLCDFWLGEITSFKDSIIFVGSGELYRTDTSFSKWIKSPGFECWQPTNIATCFEFHSDTVLVGVYQYDNPPPDKCKIYQSTNMGESWELIYSNWGWGRIFDMCQLFDGTLFIATESGIRFSKDGGKTLQNTNLPYMYARIIFSDASDDLYTSLGSTGIYISRDYGNSWSQSSDLHAICITQDNTGNIYLGAPEGLFVSQDAGQTWNKINFCPDAAQ